MGKYLISYFSIEKEKFSSSMQDFKNELRKFVKRGSTFFSVWILIILRVKIMDYFCHPL